jgi:hypothetical protein
MIAMFCVSDTLVAKTFKNSLLFQKAASECPKQLPAESRKCLVSEASMHQAFLQAKTKEQYEAKRVTLLRDCHTCVAAARGKAASACEQRCVKIVNRMYESRVFTEICDTSGGAVCEFVMKKDRKLPSAWTVDGNKAFHTFLNKRRDSCFCMRHCNSDITCSAPSREWPQNHSAAEAAVVKIAMAADNDADSQAICRWANGPSQARGLCPPKPTPVASPPPSSVKTVGTSRPEVLTRMHAMGTSSSPSVGAGLGAGAGAASGAEDGFRDCMESHCCSNHHSLTACTSELKAVKLDPCGYLQEYSCSEMGLCPKPKYYSSAKIMCKCYKATCEQSGDDTSYFKRGEASQAIAKSALRRPSVKPLVAKIGKIQAAVASGDFTEAAQLSKLEGALELAKEWTAPPTPVPSKPSTPVPTPRTSAPTQQPTTPPSLSPTANALVDLELTIAQIQHAVATGDFSKAAELPKLEETLVQAQRTPSPSQAPTLKPTNPSKRPTLAPTRKPSPAPTLPTNAPSPPPTLAALAPATPAPTFVWVNKPSHDARPPKQKNTWTHMLGIGSATHHHAADTISSIQISSIGGEQEPKSSKEYKTKLAATYDKLEHIAELQGNFEQATRYSALESKTVESEAQQGSREHDMQSLLTIRDSTGYALWSKNRKGWGDLERHATLGECAGVTVDTNGRVVTLDLDGSGLSGQFPWNAVARLSALKILKLGDNTKIISSQLPATIGVLTKLTVLSLYRFNLKGSADFVVCFLFKRCFPDSSGILPDEIGDLRSLKALSLSFNKLTGDIPVEIGDLANLQSLALFNNRLDGTLPRTIGGCTSLRILNLNSNRLTGAYIA